MEKVSIFFSWASEHQDTRRFILEVLKNTKKSLSSHGIELDVQQATSNTLGFVKIDDLILERIEKCDFFVADLTPIKKTRFKIFNKDKKQIPNINVCFELGYMMGRHGVERVFGMCNKEFLDSGNPSKDLPFDFNHNRITSIELGDTKEEQKESVKQNAELIQKVILQFQNNGNLHSWQSLKNHDVDIHKRISDDMEKFKDEVYGPIECLESYSDGSFEYLRNLQCYLNVSANHFADTSLEIYREKLLNALSDFLSFQAFHTHSYFSAKDIKCTKFYLIEGHPELCEQYGLPCIDKMKHEDYLKAIKTFEAENKEYRDKAKYAVQCYEDLEKRYLFLVN